jgi:hypothetical protein
VHRAWLLAPIVTAIVYNELEGWFWGCAARSSCFLASFKTVPALTFGAAAIAGRILLGPSRAQAMDFRKLRPD